MRAGAQTCTRSCYDVYFGREARPAALGRARRRAATERAKSDTKLIAQGCNTSTDETMISEWTDFSTQMRAGFKLPVAPMASCVRFAILESFDGVGLTSSRPSRRF